MRTCIPAQTILTCDRCKAHVPSELDFHHFELEPNYLDEMADDEFDLCTACREQFNEFMELKR